jgi:NADH dehydrogenase
MEQRIVTIIGGTGFVGRYVVKLLANAGYTLRVISRNPNSALHLKTSGAVGQIVLEQGDLTNPQTLVGKIEGSYAVVNLAGILFQGGAQTFASVHTHGTEKLAQMAKAAGVKRFIHISALGVDKASGSQYARSKVLGEKAVLDAFPEATILRPSVIFGPEDNFINMFASLAGLSCALPLIGGGKTKFQPVYVGDVAKAVENALSRSDAMGQTYELGGPEVMTFKQILQFILKTLGIKRCLITVPFSIAPAAALGAELLGKLIHPPLLTRDQVKLLKHDNIVSTNSLHFAHLGISPTAIEVVAPEYLARYMKKSREKKYA